MRDLGSTIEILELLLRVDSARIFPRSVQLFPQLGDLAAGASSHPVGRIDIEYATVPVGLRLLPLCRTGHSGTASSFLDEALPMGYISIGDPL